MRFGVLHRLMTDLVAALGLLALISTGELNRWMAAAVTVGAAAALALPPRWQEREPVQRIGTYGPLLLLALQLGRWGAGEPILQLAIEFAAALQVVRLATRRGAAHDQQVLVLALLHLIAGTVLGSGVLYGLCFLGFLVVGPAALVLSHLRREVEGNYRQGARDRTGLPVDVPRILRSRRVVGRKFLLFTCSLSVPIFAFTALLFVLFPRVGLSLLLLNHPRPDRMVGFSDRVDLGGVGKLRSDPTIALRVEYPELPKNPPPRVALYLRGTAFDRYDGSTWSRTISRRVPVELNGQTLPLTRYPDPERDQRMTIDLEPIDPTVLFIPRGAVALRVLPRGAALADSTPAVYAGPEGELKYLSLDDSGIRYRVYLGGTDRVNGSPLSLSDRDRYLALPPKLTARTARLAREWAGDSADPLQQARSVERHLRTEFRYDVDSPSGAAANPLDHFLFESRRGHCEFYSTAMAILLRIVGVPTRAVTGFYGGTYNRFGGYYAVRQGDAHSWVEAHIAGRGWVRFDPTPPTNAAPQTQVTGWLALVRDVVEATAQRYRRHVISYDLHQQLRLLGTAQRFYDRLSWRSGRPGGFGSPRRLALILAGLALMGTGAWWLFRERRGIRSGRRTTSEPEHVTQREIVRLYGTLEAALRVCGIPRHPGTPPYAHAQALADIGHPLGPEALRLTELYLEVRFGGGELSESLRRDFARSVRALRQTPAAATKSRRLAA
jgi:transglutaminase-like putative cysteine protease